MRSILASIAFISILSSIPLHSYSQDSIDCFREIDPYFWSVDVPSLIHIESPQEALSVREDIIAYLWPGGFPSEKLPKHVRPLQKDEVPDWIQSVNDGRIESVDRLDITMDYDLHSFAYHLRPVNPNNQWVLLHKGHSDDLTGGGYAELMQYLLDRGFSLITFWMPLRGENNLTARNVPGLGDHTFGRPHNEMPEILENKDGSFIRFFIEPVVVAINYIDNSFPGGDFHMVGLSGGGWTTHISAAIDPRIRHSIAVSGSLPLYCWPGPCPWGSNGDAEQKWPALYEQRANYLDIYILGSWGKGRKFVHVLNQFDPCCFSGVNYRTFEPYVRNTVRGLGQGSYSIYLDSSHKAHKISDIVITDVIGKTLK